MNMKQLRRIHRDRFTTVVETKVGNHEVEKVRVKREPYVSFKAWLRFVQPEDVMMEVEELTGKALGIREGRK